MERVPLPRMFMLTSMIGFLVVTVYTASGKIDLKWGFAFDFAFALMFIASMISITPPSVEKPERPLLSRAALSGAPAQSTSVMGLISRKVPSGKKPSKKPAKRAAKPSSRKKATKPAARRRKR